MGRTIGGIVESKKFIVGHRHGPLNLGLTIIEPDRLAQHIAAWRIQAEGTSDMDERKHLCMLNHIATTRLAKYVRSEEKAREMIKKERIKMGNA